jgi:NAD(P)-dependent dehydrogenase (short-subunit alcohol dehydrogenase family)
MKEFKDTAAVITGGASGIGRGIAERCAQEGMKVVLADIEQEALTKYGWKTFSRSAIQQSHPHKHQDGLDDVNNQMTAPSGVGLDRATQRRWRDE